MVERGEQRVSVLGLVVLGVVCAAMLVIGMTNVPRGDVATWGAGEVVVAVFLLGGAVLGMILAILLLELFLGIVLDARARWKAEGDLHLRHLEAAGKLTSWQAAVVPGMRYRTALGLVVKDGMVESFLITNSGDIPLEFVQDFLRRSDSVHLCPTSTWSDKTAERAWAQALTGWLVDGNYAEPWEGGNKPAAWSRTTSRFDVAALFDLEVTDGRAQA